MKEKKKILLVTGIYPLFKGGAEYQMRLIADQLNEQYEVVYVYLGDIPGRTVESTRLEIVDGYKVYFIKTCGRIDGLLLKRSYAKELYKVVRRERPDFVYQRVLKFMSYYLAKYQAKLKYRHIIHIADVFTLEFKRKSLRDKINFYFFLATVKYQPHFVVQTGEQSTLLRKLGVAPSLQLYNMHPKVEIDVLSVARHKINNTPKHIVWVANIKPIKQLEVFVDLAVKFVDVSDFHFTVIGDIQDSSYASEIVKRMAALSNITHYKDKDNSFVNRYILEKASLVVNTSKSEGFSNVFIQSWLRGVPVLSLNSNPDLLFDKHPDFGICANDSDNLVKGLEKILDCNTYVTRAENCYNVSRQLFSFDNVNRLKRLLEEI